MPSSTVPQSATNASAVNISHGLAASASSGSLQRGSLDFKQGVPGNKENSKKTQYLTGPAETIQSGSSTLGHRASSGGIAHTKPGLMAHHAAQMSREFGREITKENAQTTNSVSGKVDGASVPQMNGS